MILVRRLVLVSGIVAFAVCPSAVAAQGPATTPTFSLDVAPIFYENCAGCHRAGEMAPMSLLTYEEARPWARSIREQILQGVMPPWHAEEPIGTFLNERHLTADQRTTIVNWVDNGAPEGDPQDLPPTPEFATGWTIGTPDAIFAMNGTFEVPATGEIAYQYRPATVDFTEDKWVQAIEIRPSAPSVVHHVLVYSRGPNAENRRPVFRDANLSPQQVARREAVARLAENLPERPQRSNRLGPVIATTAPGTNAQVFGPGQAMLVKGGSVLTFQIHYTANGEPTTDQTRVGFVFAEQPPRQEVRSAAFSNRTFVIPAGAPNHRVDSAIEFIEDTHILAIFPHTHLRGKSWEYRMVYPDGKSEVVLSTPNYDFNWQTYYEFAIPLAAPSGSRLEATAHFDNSAANRDNPDPLAEVRWGDQTWEEMQYTGITFVVDDSSPAP